MSLQIKKICSLKLKGTPLYDNIFNNISVWKQNINEEISSDNINTGFFENNSPEDPDLNILCIQGVYGYRTGLIGKLFNIYSSYFSEVTKPIYLQSILKTCYNIDSNDYEIISFGISLVSRLIPINNIFVYDSKSELSNAFSNNLNDSQPSIVDCSSLFLLKPLFDSGCAIYSNRKYTECGFEKWNCTFNNEKYKNKGMVWCYYKSKDEKNGTTVINLDFQSNNNDLSDIADINQLINLKNNLEVKFYSEDTVRYETYIVGNFNILFNMSNIIKEIEDKLVLLQNANIRIISDNESASCEKFILYNKVEKKELITTFVNNTKIFEESILYKVEVNNENKLQIKEEHEPVTKNEEEVIVVEYNTEELVISDEIEYKENYFETDNTTASVNSQSSEDWEHII